jgi:transcriptional regulator
LYLPAHFKETDVRSMQRLIEDFPLGTLVTAGASGLTANHLPFELDAGAGALGTLRCHVARDNPVWSDALAGASQALAIFQGSSAYISPNWYPTKGESHRVVPTYNYTAVHAHGRIEVWDDEKWLRGLLGRLTRRFEASQPKPWKMADAPADFLSEQLKRIVGIEIIVDRIEGKTKMSQNRSEADRRGVVEGLDALGTPTALAVAAEVQRQIDNA